MIPATDPIPFGKMTPDMGSFNNSGALIAKNCISQGEVYKPFAEKSEQSNALPSLSKGGFTYRNSAGAVTIFGATKTSIYKLNGTSWVDVSRVSGGAYTTPDDGFWDFVSYGDLVIATNYTDDIQVMDMSVGASNFTQLSPTAPRCRRMFVFKNFLVCVDTVDIDGDVGYRVRWSPLGDPRGVWTDDPTGTQADHQDIYGGDFSNVFGAALQDFAVIVQGKSLWRMDYVGGNEIFTFSPIDTGRGSILPRSCIANGRSVFFLGEDGFYEYNGAEVIPIGHNEFDKYFYSLFDETYSFHLNCTVDPLKKNVLWSFPTVNNSHSASGINDYILCYNWVDRRATIIEDDCEVLFSYLTAGYTLEDLDSLYPSLEGVPYSLDSRIWTGGKTVLGCFSGNHKLSAYSGVPKTAVIGTSEIQPNPSGRATVYSVIPFIDGGSIRARIGYRNIINNTVSWTPYVSQNSMTGEVDFLKDARFFRVELEVSGSWTLANSISFRATPSSEA